MVNARQAARKAIESTYEGICSIVEYGDILDEQTKITSQGHRQIPTSAGREGLLFFLISDGDGNSASYFGPPLLWYIIEIFSLL